MKKEGRLSGSGFGVQGSRLARRAARPLIMDESFARIRNAKLEMRNEKWWCGAKMMKRRSILIALRAYRHFERSPQSLLQNAHRLM